MSCRGCPGAPPSQGAAQAGGAEAQPCPGPPGNPSQAAYNHRGANNTKAFGSTQKMTSIPLTPILLKFFTVWRSVGLLQRTRCLHKKTRRSLLKCTATYSSDEDGSHTFLCHVPFSRLFCQCKHLNLYFLTLCADELLHVRHELHNGSVAVMVVLQVVGRALAVSAQPSTRTHSYFQQFTFRPEEVSVLHFHCETAWNNQHGVNSPHIRVTDVNVT